MATKKTKKKSAKKKTSAGKPNALEFTRAYLKKKPKASFAEIRDAAKKKRLTLWPISYGRAQLLEGIVTVKKKAKFAKKKSVKTPGRGRGRPKGSKNKVKPGPGRPKGSLNKRGPGRPRMVATAGLDSLEAIVATVKNLQRERDQAVKMLDQIRGLLD